MLTREGGRGGAHGPRAGAGQTRIEQPRFNISDTEVPMSANQGSSSVRAIVARRVRTLRKCRGMTQNDLSVATGISRGRISAIEQGRCNVRLDSLDRIARVLGVPMSHLFDDRINEGSGWYSLPSRRVMERPAAYLAVGTPGRRPGAYAAPSST